MKDEMLAEKTDSIRRITVAHAAAMLKTSHVFLVDVREESEFLEERIAGSVNRPLGQLTAEELKREAKDRMVIIICLSGDRSEIACRRLQSRLEGVENVVLSGGIVAWRKAGYETIKKNGSAALPLMQQVYIAAGLLVVIGCLLTIYSSMWFLGIPLFVGSGLVFAGATGWCGMLKILGWMPWNN